MSVFYFTDQEGNFYELSSTTDITVSEPARATTSPVESGKSITDNFVIEPRVVTFTGVITNIKVIGQDESRRKDVDQWIEDIRQLRVSKQLLNVHVDSLNIIPNCLMVSFDITKNKSHGLSGWGCSFRMQEILISDRARIVEIPKPKESVSDDLAGKKNSGNQTTKVVEGEELTRSISNVFGYFTGESEDGNTN